MTGIARLSAAIAAPGSDASRAMARTSLTLLAVAGLYVATGKLGLRFASVNASATPVWPPTGIALAALLLLGWRAWPAIFVGAFVVNVTTAGSWVTALGIALGNTVEAVARRPARRAVRGRPPRLRARDGRVRLRGPGRRRPRPGGRHHRGHRAEPGGIRVMVGL
jgi:hypothetical protein